MLTLLSKAKVYLIMFAALSAFVGIAYWYYKDSQATIAQYAENQASLQVAVATQEAAMNSLQSDLKRMGVALNKLNNEFEASRKVVNDLQNELNIRDIGKVAITNPTRMEEELNKGTVEAFKCVEMISGKEGDYNGQEYFDCTDGSRSISMQ